MISSLEKLAKTTDEKIVAVKNAKGSIFHIIYAKSEDDTEPSRMVVMFLTKDKGKFYINGLNIQFYENEDLKKRISNYLDNLIIYDSEKTHEGVSGVAEVLK
jgi:ABC-type Na+ transport system ATPase subunit NatA